MRSSFVALVVVIVVARCFGGCSDDGARSPCSTGPARTELPYLGPDGWPSTPPPQCVARCGPPGSTVDGNGNRSNLSSVPNGACEHEDEVCEMARETYCASTGSLGIVDQVGCFCRSGNWECGIIYQGAGGCFPATATDASTD